MRKAFLLLILGVSLGGCAYGPGYVVDDGPYLYGRPAVDVGVGFYGVGGSYGGSYRHHSGHRSGHHVGHLGGGHRSGGHRR